MQRPKNPARPLSAALLVASIAAGLTWSAPTTLGQSVQRQIVSRDDGGEHTFTNLSSPNMGDVRTPDFVRRDLPTFHKILQLDDPQRELLAGFFDEYLAAFEQAMKDMLPESRGMMIGGPAMLESGDPAIMDGEDHQGMRAQAVTIALDGIHLALDEAMQDVAPGTPVQIEVQATTSDDGEGGAFVVEGKDGEFEAGDVFVAVSAEGDEALSDELRAKLEEVSRQMAEKIRQQQEAGGQLGEAAQQKMFTSIEQMQKHFEELAQKAEEFGREKDRLREQFVSDVQGILTDAQLGRWPALERTLTRQKTLPKGRLDGERTDLVALVEQVELSAEQRAPLAEVLDQYELVLHEALLRRNEYLKENVPKIDGMLSAGEVDKSIPIVNRATAMRVAVRSINEQFLSAAAEKLDEAPAAALNQKFLTTSYPRAYRSTLAQRAFEKARALEDLSPEAAAAIEELQQSYEASLPSVQQTIQEAIHRAQPDEARRNIERMAAMMSGEMPDFAGDEHDPIRAALHKRTELDERTMKQLYSALTEEQVSKLPKLPSQRQTGPVIIRKLGGDSPK